ncbi:MAG: hypothetical protein ABSA39_13255 [Edaphobacter sp.]
MPNERPVKVWSLHKRKPAFGLAVAMPVFCRHRLRLLLSFVLRPVSDPIQNRDLTSTIRIFRNHHKFALTNHLATTILHLTTTIQPHFFHVFSLNNPRASSRFCLGNREPNRSQAEEMPKIQPQLTTKAEDWLYPQRSGLTSPIDMRPAWKPRRATLIRLLNRKTPAAKYRLYNNLPALLTGSTA